ncbi:MAG: DUF4328 domain-containing protein, partial [Candidatus Dormibacteria bacterium]
YRSLGPWTGLLIAALAAAVTIEVAKAIADGRRIDVLNRILDYGTVSRAEAQASDRLIQLADRSELVVFTLCAAVFLLWLYRAVSNGPALGAGGLRFSPRWAIGWWFVPIAFLVRPFQAIMEAWRSADLTQPTTTAYSRRALPIPRTFERGGSSTWRAMRSVSSVEMSIFTGMNGRCPSPRRSTWSPASQPFWPPCCVSSWSAD